MKHFPRLYRLSVLQLMAVMLCVCVQAQATQRKQCIDSNWHFMYGDGSSAMSDATNADSWRTLTLPHDWSVETEAAQQAGGRVVGPFSSNSVGGYQTGFTVGGEGWYQKTLNVSAEDLMGRVTLYFEGAYNQSWLYVNGTEVNFCPYGYSSYRVDVTDQLHEGANNIVVKVQNTGSNSRWYAGSGIYRHVWLIKTNALHADEWDTFIKTTNNRDISFSTVIYNERTSSVSGSIEVSLRDANGVEVERGTQAFGEIDSKSAKNVSLNMTIADAKTWSPETPYLYTFVVTVKSSDGTVCDSFSKRFGVRTLSFSASEGFLLNGVRTLIKGGCVHHDNGLLGAAAFDKAERRKLMLIKEQGYNAVRCSHNLPSENFLDLCDELGLMVIDETFDQWLLAKNADDYHRYFPLYSDRDISDMVRRDRNHPSIIMWSIGNEIPGRIEPEGMAAAARLRADILALDDTRPITAAICGWDQGDAWNVASGNWDVQCEKAFQSLDVGGYNYLYDKYERDHAAAPDRVMCGMESYPKQASENWTLVEKHPYVIGDFVWTVMDYLGEAGIGAAYADRQPSMFQSWPWFNGNCGDIDLVGQKKPQSYYRDIVWRQKAVTMAVQPTDSRNNAWGWQLEEQSWTWPGYEGKNVTINVYSRAPKVRLYLNGVSQGDHTPGSTFWTGYTVAYQPGELRVVNLDNSGNEVDGEDFVLQTTGKATSARLVYFEGQNVISAEDNDLCYVTIELIDDKGRVVTSDNDTELSVSNIGAGELIGCCTGAPDDMKSFRSLTPTVFRGRALAVVRSNGTAGEVKLNVELKEKGPEPISYFLKNGNFGTEDLDNWVTSSNRYIAYNGSVWHSTELDGFLECFAGWGPAKTLSGQSVSQSTKVMPAGKYSVKFDYNGTFRSGNSSYQTEGTLKGVTVSMGDTKLSLESIDANHAQHAGFTFTLTEPKAVSFLISFASDTNADWFALDNVEVSYEGIYSFEDQYVDRTVDIPAFNGTTWPRMSGNASGSYTEKKLGSSIYNGEGLAYWASSAPRGTDFFRENVTNLPAGRYGIAAFCAANLWAGSDNDRNPQGGTTFFARIDNDREVSVPVTTATYGLYSLVIDLAEGESLAIGMHADDANGNNWCYIGGITLVQLNGGDITGVSTVPASIPTYDSKAQTYDLSGKTVDESSLGRNTIYIKNGHKWLCPN